MVSAGAAVEWMLKLFKTAYAKINIFNKKYLSVRPLTGLNKKCIQSSIDAIFARVKMKITNKLIN